MTTAAGATNAVRLDTSSGLSTIGIELRDFASASVPNVAVVGFSLNPIPKPGFPSSAGRRTC